MKESITRTQLKQLLHNKTNMTVIDVRTSQEYDDAHIPFAVNLPIEVIDEGEFIPEPGKVIITVCGKGGGRSENAAKLIREMSTNTIYFLEGGTSEWVLNEN